MVRLSNLKTNTFVCLNTKEKKDFHFLNFMLKLLFQHLYFQICYIYSTAQTL